METVKLGSVVRALRIRRRWRQADLAASARVSRGTIWRIEHGHMTDMTLSTLMRVAAELEMRLDLVPRWRGGELDRLLNAAHSAMHEQVAAVLGALPVWLFAPEVTFSIYGERGVIDVLAFHPIRRALCVIELKTEVVDAQQVIGTVDRYARLSVRIARERGWRADSVSRWLIIRETMTNRRRVAAHVALFGAAFPHDSRFMRGWLRDPHGEARGLTFLSDARPRGGRGAGRGVQRVRPRLAPVGRAHGADQLTKEQTVGFTTSPHSEHGRAGRG